MSKNSIKQRAQKVPADIKLLVSKSLATAKQINKILEEQGKTQRDLAKLLGKKESEISKWLQGTHNFTYKTICKIEIVLEEQIIFTADQAIQNISFYRAIVTNKTTQDICLKDKQKAINPSTLNKQKLTATSDNSTETNGANKFSLSLLESCFNN
jgi:transcriptional regulator with XRE-family HTH domain